jgi:MFS family permease
MKNPESGTFRSLRNFNFRLWTVGGLISNAGTWMQRVAQDWLVLTRLTHHDASALGIVTGLQFAPQVLLLPWTGSAADRLNQRRLLMCTQATMGVLALLLGVLTIEGAIRLWQVYVFAFLSGSAAALDAPVRQTFVAEMVGDGDLANAVALNSSSFNAAQMVGPAVAGVLIAKVGIGWAFVVNGISFGAVLISMSFFRLSELRTSARAHRTAAGFLDGFLYVWRSMELRAILIMLFLIGTFAFNFPIFISTMAVNVFHSDASGFGLLSSIMAIGTLSGALFSAGRRRPGLGTLAMGAGVFGGGCTLAALAPGYWWFAAALVVVGGGGADVYEWHKQHHAALDRPYDAGQGDGAAGGRGAGGHDDRRSDCGVGCEPLRATVVAGRGSGGVLRRCAGGGLCSGSAKRETYHGVVRAGLWGSGLAVHAGGAVACFRC